MKYVGKIHELPEHAVPCLDVRSPDVNFLRKVMSGSRHDGAAYSRHPCRQSADADIVSAFPLSFSTFLENINILRQTSSTWHRILREFCVLKSFQKPVAPAGYKNKQCRKQTSVLSGRIVTAYVPLRSATERERAAFLIPCQGLRDYFTNSQFSSPRQACAVPFPPALWSGSGCHGFPVLRRPRRSSRYHPGIRSLLPSIHNVSKATDRSPVPA